MTTLLLAAMAIIKFDGGVPNDFAATLADNLKQNVVISLGEPRMIEKATFDAAELDVMSREIRTQTKLVMLPGSELVFSDQLLSRELVQDSMQMRRRGGEAPQFEVAVQPEIAIKRIEVGMIGLPAKAVSDGKVSFKTEKSEGLQLRMLAGGLGKPVEVHWIYERTPVFANVKDLPILDFAKWAARAVGAKFVSSEKSYNFELDAQEVRKRAVATIKMQPVGPAGSEQAKEAEQARNFRLACINALTTKQVAEALATQGSSARILLSSRGPITGLAIQRIRQLEQMQLNYSQEIRAPRNAVGLLQRIDNSRPAILTVSAQFDVRMEIPVLDQNGRSAGIVRL
jgi:hypothetical protein